MSANKTYNLKIGETTKVRPSFFKSAESIVYAGMINDLTYSVVITWTFGYNSMGYNLYLQKNKKEFVTPKGHVKIEYVSTEEIRFNYTES